MHESANGHPTALVKSSQYIGQSKHDISWAYPPNGMLPRIMNQSLKWMPDYCTCALTPNLESMTHLVLEKLCDGEMSWTSLQTRSRCYLHCVGTCQNDEWGWHGYRVSSWRWLIRVNSILCIRANYFTPFCIFDNQDWKNEPNSICNGGG